MQFLPYLAAHQAVQRLSTDQFNPERQPERAHVAEPSRLDSLRAGTAVLLRRTADRLEPVGVRSRT